MTDKIDPTAEEYAEVMRRYERDGGLDNGFKPDHVGHIEGAETVDDLNLTDELFAEAHRIRGNPEAAARLLGEEVDEDDEDDLAGLFGGGDTTDEPDAESPWADKSGAVAGLLSILWPGTGHLYLGGDATVRGVGLIVYSLVSLALVSVLIGIPMIFIGILFAYADVQSLINTGSGVSSEAEP